MNKFLVLNNWFSEISVLKCNIRMAVFKTWCKNKAFSIKKSFLKIICKKKFKKAIYGAHFSLSKKYRPLVNPENLAFSAIMPTGFSYKNFRCSAP
jgi:hypothetical protein